jgi:hypothetical protein
MIVKESVTVFLLGSAILSDLIYSIPTAKLARNIIYNCVFDIFNESEHNYQNQIYSPRSHKVSDQKELQDIKLYKALEKIFVHDDYSSIDIRVKQLLNFTPAKEFFIMYFIKSIYEEKITGYHNSDTIAEVKF